MVRRLSPIIGIVLILLISAGFVGYFGVWDLGRALFFAERFTGGLLVIAAVIMAAGAVGVLDHSFSGRYQFSGLVALIGTVVAIVANVMLLVLAIENRDLNAWLIVWSLLAVGSVFAAYAVYRTYVVIPAPRTVGVLAMAAVVGAVANFGYAKLYRPYAHSTNLTISAELGDPILSPDSKSVAYPINITLANRSDVDLYILGNEYTVWEIKEDFYPAGRGTSTWWRNDLENEHIGDKLSQNSRSRQPVYIQSAAFMEPGSRVTPGDTVKVTHMVELPVPKKFYANLTVKADAVVARKDKLRIESGKPRLSWRHHDLTAPQRIRNFDYAKYQVRIHENDAISDLTRDPRYLTVWWVFGSEAPFITTVSRRGEDDRENSSTEAEDASTRYGLVTATTEMSEKSLWRLK